MKLQDIAHAHSFLWRKHRGKGVVFVGLVDDKQIMLGSKCLDIRTGIDLTRRIVGITEPTEISVRLFLITMQTAGILIFGERGMIDIVGLSITKSLCNQINRISGTTGHQHLICINPILMCYHRLQRMGGRLWIGTNQINMATQMCLQLRQVGMGIDIGTKVHPNTLVTVYVIAVSVNHCLVGFGRVSPYSDAVVHDQPTGHIAVP